MADAQDAKALDSAEKAYAAASEGVSEKSPDLGDSIEVPVEFPAKRKRARKAILEEAKAPEPEPAPPPVAAELPAADPIIEAAPIAKPARARSAGKPAKKTPPLAVKAAAAKAVAAKSAAKRVLPKPVPVKAPPIPAPIKPRKPVARVVRTPAPAIATSPAVNSPPFIAKLKEIPMDLTATVKAAVSGAQEKAKEAFTKSSALAGEYGEFTKGNVEALVQSSKILASGMQGMGTAFIADSKAAFESSVADVKELSAAKSPADFFTLQTELMRRNFDSAVAYGSKTSEAMLKLTNDVFAPLSTRVSLAVEKVRSAA